MNILTRLGWFTVSLIRRIAKLTLPNKEKSSTVDVISKVVSNYFHLKQKYIVNARRFLVTGNTPDTLDLLQN